MTMARITRLLLLAVSLGSASGPAFAQAVTLSCATSASGAITLRIDYATGIVQMVGGERANGTVSADSISWSARRTFIATAADNVTKREVTSVFNGRLDRLSGTGWVETGFWPSTTNLPVTCGKVTAPKF